MDDRQREVLKSEVLKKSKPEFIGIFAGQGYPGSRLHWTGSLRLSAILSGRSALTSILREKPLPA